MSFKVDRKIIHETCRTRSDSETQNFDNRSPDDEEEGTGADNGILESIARKCSEPQHEFDLHKNLKWETKKIFPNIFPFDES